AAHPRPRDAGGAPRAGRGTAGSEYGGRSRGSHCHSSCRAARCRSCAGDFQHVVQNAARGHRRPRARSGDDERILLVAHGREDKLIVGPVERGHRARRVDHHQPDADAARRHDRPVAQYAAARGGRGHALLPWRVVFLEAPQELLRRQVLRAVGDERLDGDVPELSRKAQQPSENERLARHVEPREVVARVGLGIPLGDRAAQRRREPRAPAQLAEQVAERTGRSTIDLRDAGACRATNPTASAAAARRPPVALASGVPLAFAAASVARRRGERPPASNTRPLRSISATMRSVSPSCFTFAIIGASVRPICPNPSSTTSVRSGCATAPPPIFESWNAACTARWARGASLASTTSERFSSDEPCAVAITLIRASASAENTRAAMPGVPAIPSPTTTSVARPVRTSTPSISWRPISGRNVSSRLLRARSALSPGTLKQIECSDDAWVMSETEMPW